MAITLQQARTYVFEHLRAQLRSAHRPVTTEIVGVERGIKPLAARDGVEIAWNSSGQHLEAEDSVNVRAALSELENSGVIVWGRSTMQPKPPALQLTEFGLQCLREGRINPYDPDGYLAALAERVPTLDRTVKEYLEEALECLRRTCYRACAVMLGGASERVMLMLIASFHQALQDAPRRTRFEKRAITPVPIRQRVDHFRKELANVRRTLPRAVDEDLDLKLDGIFALIRAARNDAGHPSINAISRETVHGNLLLFPSYCERAHALIEHFGANPIP